jgi:hypothetical protein
VHKSTLQRITRTNERLQNTIVPYPLLLSSPASERETTEKTISMTVSHQILFQRIIVYRLPRIPSSFPSFQTRFPSGLGLVEGLYVPLVVEFFGYGYEGASVDVVSIEELKGWGMHACRQAGRGGQVRLECVSIFWYGSISPPRPRPRRHSSSLKMGKNERTKDTEARDSLFGGPLVICQVEFFEGVES